MTMGGTVQGLGVSNRTLAGIVGLRIFPLLEVLASLETPVTSTTPSGASRLTAVDWVEVAPLLLKPGWS